MLQVLPLGLFISCFKQLYFGIAPSQVLSAGITACCTRHHLLCTLPSCTRGRSELIWKRKSSFKSFPARWKHCRSPDFNLEAEQSPSGRRERHQLVGSRCHRLPSSAGRGASAGSGCSCSGTGAQGSAFLQLDSAFATTDWGGRVEKQPLPEPAGLESCPTAQLWPVAASAAARKKLARRKARWWEMLRGRAVGFPAPRVWAGSTSSQ